MSTSGLSATSQKGGLKALYVTSFPPKSYRRPIMAARALRFLGIYPMIVEGWKAVDSLKPARLLASLSRLFPAPLSWLSRDAAYELETFKVTLNVSASLCFNLNVLGAVGMRVAAKDRPLILDMQDFTIQDDHTIPFYDQQTLKTSAPDLVIFASEPIRRLVERRCPKLLRRTAYVPFGIDLATFDRHYTPTSAWLFRYHLSAMDKPLLVYTGGAIFGGIVKARGSSLCSRPQS